MIAKTLPPKASREAHLGPPCQLALFDPIGGYTAPVQKVSQPAIARYNTQPSGNNISVLSSPEQVVANRTDNIKPGAMNSSNFESST
jgi:hypothetical protein